MNNDNIMDIFQPIFKSIANTAADGFMKDVISNDPALVTTVAYCLCGCGALGFCAYVGVTAYTYIKREKWLQKQMENCKDTDQLKIYAEMMARIL